MLMLWTMSFKFVNSVPSLPSLPTFTPAFPSYLHACSDGVRAEMERA